MPTRRQIEFTREDWEAEYDAGGHLSKWDYAWPTPDLVAAAAALELGAGTRALDLGCGTGADAIYLASKGMTVSAIDLSASALRSARARARVTRDRVVFCQANVLALPLPDQSIDFIADRGCLHSLPVQHWPVYAAEVARVLRPRGHCLIRGARQDAGGHFTALSRDSITAAFGTEVFEHLASEPIQLCISRLHLPAMLVLLKKR